MSGATTMRGCLLTVLIRLLLLPIIGAVVIGAGLGVIFLIGFVGSLWGGHEYDQKWRSADEAAAARTANLDLAAAVDGTSSLPALLGPPVSSNRTPGTVNSTDQSWLHDGGLTAEFLDAEPPSGPGMIDLKFGAKTQYGGPAFRGSFMGLRLGDPPPSADAAAALQAKAKECCGVEDVVWMTTDNRITNVEVTWAHYSVPQYR